MSTSGGNIIAGNLVATGYVFGNGSFLTGIVTNAAVTGTVTATAINIAETVTARDIYITGTSTLANVAVSGDIGMTNGKALVWGTTSGSDPGPLVEKRYNTTNDRYGIGQLPGSTKVYASAFGSVALSVAQSATEYVDLVSATTSLISLHRPTAIDAELVVKSVPVLETLRNCAALAFPRVSIGDGTTNGNGTTHRYIDDSMTGNIFVSASSEVSFQGATFQAFRAFDKNSSTFWTHNDETNGSYTDGPGPFLPTSNVFTTVGTANVRGEYIQIQFPVPLSPTSYQMLPRPQYVNRSPVRWRLAACTANVPEVNLAANVDVQSATVWTELHIGNVQTQALADGVSWPWEGRKYRLNTTETFDTFRLISEATANQDSFIATFAELTLFGFPVPKYSV